MLWQKNRSAPCRLLDLWGVIIDFMNHDSFVNPLLLWWLHFPSSFHHHLSPWSSSWWCFLPPTQELDFSALAPAQAAAELLRTGDFQQLPRLFYIAGRSCYVQWDVCPSFAPCCSEYGYCRTKVCLKCEPFGWKKIMGDILSNYRRSGGRAVFETATGRATEPLCLRWGLFVNIKR